MTLQSDQIRKLGYKFNLHKIGEEVVENYNLGKLLSLKYLDEGYEDFNIKLNTTEGTYVLKLFANNQLGDYTKTRRGPEVVERLVEILTAAQKIHLNTPILVEDKNHNIIFRHQGGKLVGIIYEWINGTTYFDLDATPTEFELAIIIEQAAKINKINIKPTYYHDIWAVIHMHALYKIVEEHLSEVDKDIMRNILSRFDKIPFDKLPKSFVHGDYTKGNIIKTKSGKPYIIDFSVSNWASRIIDLGIIIANLMYDTKQKTSLAKRVEIATRHYQKHTQLTPLENDYLYDLSLCQTAMEFLGSVWRQKFLNDTSEETKYWLALGRDGITQSLKEMGEIL